MGAFCLFFFPLSPSVHVGDENCAGDAEIAVFFGGDVMMGPLFVNSWMLDTDVAGWFVLCTVVFSPPETPRSFTYANTSIWEEPVLWYPSVAMIM